MSDLSLVLLSIWVLGTILAGIFAMFNIWAAVVVLVGLFLVTVIVLFVEHQQ